MTPYKYLYEHEYKQEICNEDFCVLFNNNQRERMFRCAKIKIKVSSCFQSTKGVKKFVIIIFALSVVYTHGERDTLSIYTRSV